MAPAAQKRGAKEGKNAPATKKSRSNTTNAAVNEDIQALQTFLEQAEHLPQSCRDMLSAGVGGSLSVPADERHEAQLMVIGMVGETIGAAEIRLEDTLKAAKAAEVDIETVGQDLASKCSQTEIALASQQRVVEERAIVVSDVGEKVAVATALLSEKQAEQRVGDASIIGPQKLKDDIENAIEKDMKAIVAGGGDCKKLLLLLRELKLDESLVVALPGTCAKAPADRGSFDGMVLNQLETSLSQQLMDMRKICEAAAPGINERAAAVVAAQNQLNDAIGMKVSAIMQHEAAVADERTVSAALGVSKDAMTAQATELSNGQKNREHATVALKNFQLFIRGHFEQLRDKTSSKACEVADSGKSAEMLDSGTCVEMPDTSA